MRIRLRRDDDLPRLAEVLLEQRPASRYPVNIPDSGAVDAVRRQHERAAWVAVDDDDVPVGHVCLTLVPDERAAEELVRQWLDALGCTPADLGVVSALFVAESTRGQGVGRVLMQTAIDAARDAGLIPVLDVVEQHRTARAMYEAMGWERVGESMPDWMPAGMGPTHTMVLRPR